MSEFEISVILAETPGQVDLQPTLASIERACAGLRTEVLVVRPPARPPLTSSSALTVQELAAGEETLVPERWGIGVQAASAPVFACLTTEFVVHERWARALLEALDTGAVGAAGAIAIAPRAHGGAGAVYLVRYSPYLPTSAGVTHPVGNIPGDTAAYRRGAVMAFPELLSAGFWEVEFHRRFAANGERLLFLREALATYSTHCSVNATMVLRYRHAVEYGTTRVVQHRHPVWRLILGAPIVPFVLVARILRRVAPVRGYRRLALRTLPALLAISAAWAAGEAVGAWRARGRR